MTKKITSMVLALIMILSVMAVGIVNVSAAIVDSGTCGDNVTWVLDDNGVLTISGSGEMRNFMYASPFDVNRVKEVIIEDGVTYIGAWSFMRCKNLSVVHFPNSLVNIGMDAFCECKNLSSIYIPDSVTTIGVGAFQYCDNMTNIIIGNGVESIGDIAFGYIFNPDIATIPIVNTKHINAYTSNQVAIDYFLNNSFHHSILGDYYVNYTEELPSENDIRISGRTGKSKLTVSIDTANLRVTVPTVLPVSVDSDNNVSVATNAQIQNLSQGQVDVTNAVLSSSNSWSLAAFDTDFKTVPVNTKQYGFKLLGYNVPVNGNAYNSQFSTINGMANLDLTYDANVAIQSDAINAEDIGTIVFTVAWHK